MDENVLLPDRGETVAAMFADAFGEARVVGRELQIVARDGDNLGDLVDGERTGQHADAVRRNAKLAGDEFAEFLGNLAVELDADHRAAAPSLQRGLEQLDEILGLLLDLDIAVADDPERAGALHLVAGEKLADEQAHRLLDRDEAHMGLAVRQPDEPLQGGRQAQQGRHLLAFLQIAQLQRDREAEIGNERKGMRRVDGKRRQDRKYLFEKMVLQPGQFVLQQLIRGDGLDALLLQEKRSDRPGSSADPPAAGPLRPEAVRVAAPVCARRGS